MVPRHFFDKADLQVSDNDDNIIIFGGRLPFIHQKKHE